jgi:2-polyprenyl-6-methoxyphenol hydroxylase-like FAD-dependent oxidoreductase
MRRALRVAVIGCGTAGAAAALLLSRAGHDVTVFERVPEPGPVGAGIMMQPSGLLVLERLGLARHVIARGARVSRLVCETSSGRSILDLHYESLAPGLFGVGLHRGVLFETLHQALVASPVQLRCGVAIEQARLQGERVALVDDSGGRHDLFDLAVVCDGARSRVRDAMRTLSREVRLYPWGALWFIAQDPGEQHRGRPRHRADGGHAAHGARARQRGRAAGQPLREHPGRCRGRRARRRPRGLQGPGARRRPRERHGARAAR